MGRQGECEWNSGRFYLVSSEPTSVSVERTWTPIAPMSVDRELWKVACQTPASKRKWRWSHRLSPTALQSPPFFSLQSREVDVSQIDWSKDILTSQVLVLEVNESNFSDEYVSAFLSDMLRHLRAHPHD